MKLIVPFAGQLRPVDRHLTRLAQFVGVDVLPLSLATSGGNWAEYLEKTIPSGDACFVVNPSVLQRWVGSEALPRDLASFLGEHFRHLLVHALNPEKFDSSVIRELSHGALEKLQNIESPGLFYEVCPNSTEVCGAYAGLSFGPIDLKNDRVFSCGHGRPDARTLISIARRPFLAVVERGHNKIWFLGGQDVADLDVKVGDAPVSSYFSRLLPLAMALRSIFADETWRPGEPYASVMIDDPLLRPIYGALNFESLLAVMKQHNFHSTIAFIPHNFKRSSPKITRLIRENPDSFDICFHGNDHTGAEFASTDTDRLKTVLQIAEHRMELHKKLTGLECDPVMVFPQGHFSVEAMSVLRTRNFAGAVNTTPQPMRGADQPSLGEIAQPAVLRYGNFPLFLRKNSVRTLNEDIAFNCFFGKPVLIVEHHDIFRHPEVLLRAVNRINQIAPNVHWSNLGTVLNRSVLTRVSTEGVKQIRAYSRTVEVLNDSGWVRRYSIEWCHAAEGGDADTQVFQNGRLISNFTVDSRGVQLTVDLPAGSSHTFSLVHPIQEKTTVSLGLRHNVKAFVRRRLSEVRDNYLSKDPRLLAAAKSFRRHLIG